MGDSETDLDALLDYLSAAGRVTKMDVVARLRWPPSRATEALREGVKRGLLVRHDAEGEDEPVSYSTAASR